MNEKAFTLSYYFDLFILKLIVFFDILRSVFHVIMAFFLLNRLFENSQSNRYSNRYPRIDSPINIRYIFDSVYVNDNCFSNVDSGKNVLLTC
jgi:hypothetical protein